MYTLADIRAIIRRSFLADATPSDAGVYTWSNEQIRDCLWLALDAFANHTAVATATAYPASGSEYLLPDNIFLGDDLESIGEVFVVSNTETTYLSPINPNEVDLSSFLSYYYTYPADILCIQPAPIAGSTVNLRYYAHYNRPYADSDLVSVPRWADSAIMYLTAAHALTALAVSNANIAQWKDRQDSGTPEHNALRKQQAYMFDLYERELLKVQPQNRTRRYGTQLRS